MLGVGLFFPSIIIHFIPSWSKGRSSYLEAQWVMYFEIQLKHCQALHELFREKYSKKYGTQKMEIANLS